ncbi:MAG: alanyl-tRNA editing protein, partial [Oscillibacter sp.]|nr:alanyl-tRNA editing protein [Oscillibacter sp.]
METEKLYYQDAYLTQFTARVLSCEARKGAFSIALDRTAFYPEGGGQPADHGFLRAASENRMESAGNSSPDSTDDRGDAIPVTDVHEREGVVWHTCLRAIAPGTNVAGTINWDRRFDHMQQHSGEHILSGILCCRY